MRIVSASVAMILAGALTSCSTPAPQAQQAAASLTYEAPGPVTRAPLAPPAGYGSASVPTASAGNEAAQLGWHASPRWSAIQGNGMLIDPDGSHSNLSKPRATPETDGSTWSDTLLPQRSEPRR
jgi:hypothetical protein